MGHKRRPVFNRSAVRRELRIIPSDLHCNAVRICGLELDRLAAAGHDALAQGLLAWLSPALWDWSPSITLDSIASAASTAEELRRGEPGPVWSGIPGTAYSNPITIASNGPRPCADCTHQFFGGRCCEAEMPEASTLLLSTAIPSGRFWPGLQVWWPSFEPSGERAARNPSRYPPPYDD